MFLQEKMVLLSSLGLMSPTLITQSFSDGEYAFVIVKSDENRFIGRVYIK